MCGIAGYYSLASISSEKGLEIARAMASSLTHRGPDDAGIWHDENTPLFLAHRRLSIIDLSENGHQPMLSACGRYVLTYNGEIYNFPELKKELEARGVKFRGHSDTEVLAEAFSAWGLDAMLEKIEGMFAFALWDRREKILHLARDRFGEKPLYFGWAGQGFAFASELRPFLQCPGFEKRINPDACALLIKFLCIPAPQTIFEKVWKLPPAAKLSLNLQALARGENLLPKIERYWSAQEEFFAHGSQSMAEDDFIPALKDTLLQSVRKRMISDAPLGAYLSGGLDSSLIVSMMQAQSTAPVKTFTIGFEEKPYDEAPYARAIANVLGTDHSELYISQSHVQDIIPRLPEIYDEPFANPSQLPTFLLSRFASQHVKVSLSGDGGDEFFGGYHHHDLLSRVWPRLQNIPFLLRAAGSETLAKIPKNFLKLLHEEQGYLYYRRFQTFAKFMGRRTIGEAQMGMHGNHKNAEKFLARGGRASEFSLPSYKDDSELLKQILLNDVHFHLPEIILGMVDRASMANSLEVRAPILDRAVFNLAGRLQDSLRIENGSGKIIFRRLLEEYIPKELFERKKAGFNVPIEQWLMGPLKEWGSDLLHSARFQNDDILDRDYILKNWNRLQSGHKESGRAMWAVLLLQQWREHYGV